MLSACTSIRAEYNGMVVSYNRIGSRNIKNIEFEATGKSLKAKVRGVEDREGVSQNLENVVKILDSVK
jgi:hypothetical protein